MAKVTIKGKKVTGTKKNDKIVWQNKKAWEKALTVNAGSGNDTIDFSKSKYKNTLNGQAGNDIIKGGKNVDKINGYSGKNKLYGNAGNDIITGGKGNDTITGGLGNDIVKTGKGTDTIIINKGDGNDIIYHQGKKTVVQLKTFNKKDKVAFTKNGKDLIMTYTHVKTSKDKKAVAEKVTFKGYFDKKGNIVKAQDTLYIQNALGNKNAIKLSALIKSTKVVNQVLTKKGTYYGTAFADKIAGSGANDVIYGGKGNDTITAGNGNDKINGGAGNDIINAGIGNNTIYINKGDGKDTVFGGKGNDTIVFSAEKSAEGENPASVSAAFVGNDLIITGQNGGTKTTLKDYANGDHSVKWLVVGGKTVRTDSIVPLNNINEPNTVSEYNIKSIYNGTSRPDYINISSIEYGKYGPTMVVNADKGDDVIEINSIFASGRTGDGRLYGVKVDAGEGNDNIILKSGALAQVVLKAGNGNDTISGIGYAGSGGYEGSGGYHIYNGSGGYVKYMNTGMFNQVVLDESGSKGLLTRTIGTSEYILGKQVGNDLVIKLTNGETLTIESYYKYEYNKNTVFYEGFDGCTPISKILKTDDITEIKLSSQKTNYKDLSDVIHFIDAQDSGQYNIQLGDSDKNCIAVNNGEYYNIELGNGSGNEIIVGSYYSEDPLDAYANVTVGNGDNNSIGLFTNGSFTGVTVGDGNGNSIYLDSPYGDPVDTYAPINVGHGDGNSIYVNNNDQTVIQIGNGDDNEIYSHGAGNTQINTSNSEKFYYGENTDKIGSCYMSVGYNEGDTISTTYIRSFGNDTIKGVGTVNVNIDNPTTTTKVIQTNFAEREVATKSQTIVSLGNGSTANINIELQPKSEIGYYTKYFSLLPALGSVGSSYNFVYGALDGNGNDVDGEIVISDAYVQSGMGLGGSIPFKFRFDTENLFSISGVDDYTWGIDSELQLYDMERMGSHDFIQYRDIVFNGGKALLVNGNDAIGENNGNDSIIVYGAAVNAKGGINNIISCGNDSINVTGTDNILFGPDEEDEDTHELIPTRKDIYVTSTGQANIEHIMDVGSTFIRYENNVKDVMFSFYGAEQDAETGYITLHAFDENGNIINQGDKIYGQMNGTYLDFDLGDGSLSGAPIDSKLSVKYDTNVKRTLGEMVRYYDMNNTTADHSFDSSEGILYNMGHKVFVQGSDYDDEYYYEWTDVTIKEAGSTNQENGDILTIGGDCSNCGFFYDVTVDITYNDDDTYTLNNITLGDDLILASYNYSGSSFEKMFYYDSNLEDGNDTSEVRNSAKVLTIKDYFKTEGGSIETIKCNDDDYKLNYNALIETGTLESSEVNSVTADVVAWLAQNHYSSASAAIESCTDSDKLTALMNCYTGNANARLYSDYWQNV